MTRFVIGADVALRLAHDSAKIDPGHRLFAPTLLRSQVLSRLFVAVRRGELTRAEADSRLDYIRAQHVRLLGDRVLQGRAWKVAERLGWSDTLDAEYVALTQLQADAFVTLDAQLEQAAKSLVAVAPFEALLEPVAK